jgi:hypothetical protein
MPDTADERISFAIGFTEEEVDILLDLFQRAGSGVAPRHIETARTLFPRLRMLKRDIQSMKHPERKVQQLPTSNAPPTQPENPPRPN